MTPASLLVDFGYTLGNLIEEVLFKKTLEFTDKAELIEQLRDFNRNRISFIHNSFNAKNKAKTSGLRETLDLGLQKGIEILALFDKLMKSVRS